MGNAHIKQSYRCISRSTCKKHIRSETNLADRTTITALSLIHTWNKPLTATWTLLLLLLLLITGSIARSATRRYLIYSEADFEVFRPTGATRCTDWGEIWHGGGSSSMPNVTLIGATVRVQEPQNWNFYWDLIKMWNINAPQGRIPCAIFTKFAEFVPRFSMR